jgi:hypothetical protein
MCADVIEFVPTFSDLFGLGSVSPVPGRSSGYLNLVELIR